jgi:hypothetical protein
MIASLITRVAEATGPDREIDAMVFALFPPSGLMVLGPGAGNGWVNAQWSRKNYPEPVRATDFTASIDAVEALIRREMPGADLRLETQGGKWTEAHITEPGDGYSVGIAIVEGVDIPAIARAALLAVLHALAARHTEDATQ